MPEPQREVRPEPRTGPESESGPESGPDSASGPRPGSGPKSGSGPESGSGPRLGSGPTDTRKPSTGRSPAVWRLGLAQVARAAGLARATGLPPLHATHDGTGQHATAPAAGPGPDAQPAAAPAPDAHGRAARIVAVLGLAVAMTGASLAVGAVTDDRPAGPVVTAPAADVPLERLTARNLTQGVEALQSHLGAQPKDASGWATLGAAYVEQARVSGDPTRYPQAEKALRRSLALRPAAGNDSALAGRAALAAARHDFTEALRYADRALRVNPYSERALASRVDALVELGRYDEAMKAAELADSRRPGIPVFTRYAYVLELRGDAKGARRVLEQALKSAASSADVVYVANTLGQLAWSRGRYDEALAHYERSLAAEPGNIQALEGRGRTLAAQGRNEPALRDLEEVVARYPLPGQLAALGELYEALGKRDKAAEQYELIGTWTRLARANGVATDLETALVEADHGDRGEALESARAEWERRQSIHTADALAWALHVNGRDREALRYAERAAASGHRSAQFLYHRGAIEAALGEEGPAHRHLRAALDLNRGFSPTGAIEARKLLEDTEGES
ncbi:tetratricopeptide repeat protein [Streptomyces sp. GC420]|nr:tetratricopeptide repeat protein [Streptomyces sp. GC420]NBM17204.1 tetratricopeptide repeat protein [Streptomyces sp. GC420]